jgi:16S rRNA (guanine966-N2)-methyltransferase
VFADPPYSMPPDSVARLLQALTGEGWLRPGAVVAVERSARDADLRWPPELVAMKHRRYGEGCLWYGRRASSGG